MPLDWLPLALISTVYVPLAVWLSVVDVLQHRLPNRLVAALSLGVSGMAVALVMAGRAPWDTVASAALVAAIVSVGAILFVLVFPQALGMGDAKVLFPTVFVAVLFGATAIAGALVWVCAWGLLTAIVVAIRSRSVATRFAFGPILLSAPYGGLLLASVGILG